MAAVPGMEVLQMEYVNLQVIHKQNNPKTWLLLICVSICVICG